MSELHPQLKNWLDTATENLSPTGRDRVTDEVLECYLSELDRLRNEGLSDWEAMDAAYRSLGNSRIAADEYAKLHLTQTEMEFLRPLSERFEESRNQETEPSKGGWRLSHSIAVVFTLGVVGMIALLAPFYPIAGKLLNLIPYAILGICGFGMVFSLTYLLVLKPLGSLQMFAIEGQLSRRNFRWLFAIKSMEILVVAIFAAWVASTLMDGIFMGDGYNRNRGFPIGIMILFQCSVLFLRTMWKIYKKLNDTPVPI